MKVPSVRGRRDAKSTHIETNHLTILGKIDVAQLNPTSESMIEPVFVDFNSMTIRELRAYIKENKLHQLYIYW